LRLLKSIQLKLESLAALDGVSSMRMVIPPVVRTGAVESEGDAILKANLVRDQTLANGSGVKVGIISDGADNYASAVATATCPAASRS